MLDLRFLSRRKAVAAVAIVTMGLALGANTAALSVLKALLLSGLGVPEAERVLMIAPQRELPGRGAVIFSEAYPNYQLLRGSQRAFADVAALLQIQASWRDGSEARPLDASRVSASFFPTMRVQPVIGRAIAPTEEGPSPAPVVVISHGLWQSAFAASASAIGRTMSLDGIPHTIIGVMPAGFSQPLPTDIWLPFDIPLQQRTAITGARQLTVYGRVGDGQTLEQARADVQRFGALALSSSPDNKDYHYTVQPLREVLLNNAGSTAMFVQAGALTLLGLAILNLASLLIAWGFERRQEMTVRLALGAGVRQVTNLLMQQSLVIVGAGAVLGIPVAYAALRTLQGYDLGRTVSLFVGQAEIDLPVLLATIAIALGAGLTAGALPAWFGRGSDMSSALRAASRSSTLSPTAVRWQKTMVVGQAGLSTAILAASLLIGLSFWRLMDVPDGFTTDGRVVARIVLPDGQYGRHATRDAFGRRLALSLAAEPELALAGFTTTLPVSDQAWGGRFSPERVEGSAAQDPILFHFRRISPEYFAVMGIPLLRGRAFTTADDTASQQVIVVSRALAERIWPGEDGLGKRLLRAAPGGAPPAPFTVVGVVGNTMDGGYASPPGETVYVPYAQVSAVRLSIVGQARTTPGAAIGAIRRAIIAADPMLAANGSTALEDLVANANALPRLRMMVLAVFAVVAVGIVLLGSYGVMSQLVSNRERELAVRLIFGATPSAIGASVIGQVARLTIGGVVLGLVGVWFSGGLLGAFVFGIESRSPVVYAGAAGGLLLLAAIATAPVALRAMRVDIRRGITG